MAEPEAQPDQRRVGRALVWIRSRASALIALLLIATGLPLCWLDTPMWWLGGALIVAAVSLLRSAFAEQIGALGARLSSPRRLLGKDRAPAALLSEVACVAGVIVVGLTMMRDVLGGLRPVSRDHTVHYAKAWLLHNDLLPSGQIYGWTHDMFAGYPANYLYPPGADLFVNLVHALGLGALDFSQAYAYAFVLFHLLTGISTYVFARSFAGRWVALIAGVLCVSDPGSFRMGGWQYTVEYGVWPQALSLSFSLFAFAALRDIAETRRLAPIGMFGFWMGLAFITHPIQILFAALAVVVAIVSAIVARGVQAATFALRLLLALALSSWVGALWLIPFFSARTETNQMGVWWDTTFEMAKALLNAALFPGTLSYVFALGLLGIILLLRAQRFMPLFVALMAAMVPAVTNSTMIDELHLPHIALAFSKIQWVRLSTMVKPFWFALAAYAFVAILAHARALTARDQASDATPKSSIVRTTALAGITALIVLPVIVPLAEAFATRFVLRTVMTEAERPQREDREKVERWLKTNLPNDGTFYRLGVFTGDQHDMLDIGTVVDRPLFKRGFTPASNFVYQPKERIPSILDATNTRFALSKYPLPTDLFELVQRFGIWGIYRYLDYRPEPYRILEGQGDIKVERFGREEVRLRAAPGSKGRLRINISYFSRWKAYRDGQRLPITVTYLRDAQSDTGFITVPLEPGEYRFVFERTLGDRMAVPLGLFGMLACGGLWLGDRRERFLARIKRGLSAASAALDRLSDERFMILRRSVLALVIVSSVIGFIALGTWKPPIQIAELPGLDIERVRFDFIERISTARAGIRYAESYRPCMRQGDRLVCRNAEGELDVNNYIGNTPATLKDYILVRCMRARPVDDATLFIEYPSVPVGDALIGYYGVEREGRLMSKRRPVELRITLAGREVYSAQTQTDNQIHAFKIPMRDKVKPTRDRPRTSVGFSVRADNVSRRFFCFHAQVVDVR
jgi:hypothetical protein